MNFITIYYLIYILLCSIYNLSIRNFLLKRFVFKAIFFTKMTYSQDFFRLNNWSLNLDAQASNPIKKITGLFAMVNVKALIFNETSKTIANTNDEDGDRRLNSSFDPHQVKVVGMCRLSSR